MSEPVDVVWTGPDAGTRVLLAHGAGAGMDSPFLTAVAEGMAAAGLRVGRFEFPYMVKRRADGRRRPPDRMPRLQDALRAAVQAAGGGRLVLAGKSMGGRVASLVADELEAAGLIVFGFPFHPPGKPERYRGEHLATITTPTLIVQGERDPFGTVVEAEGYAVSDAVTWRWMADGNHSLEPRKRSGFSKEEHRQQAIAAAVAFVEGLG